MTTTTTKKKTLVVISRNCVRIIRHDRHVCATSAHATSTASYSTDVFVCVLSISGHHGTNSHWWPGSLSVPGLDPLRHSPNSAHTHGMVKHAIRMCRYTHFLQASFIFEIWKFYSHRNIENNTVLCHIAGFFFIVSILFVSLFGSVRHTVNCERHTHNALALEPSSLFSTSNVCVYVSCMYKISIYHTAASVWCYAYPAYAVLLFLTSYNMNNAAWMLLLMLIPHIHVHCASCTAYCVCVCVGIPREPNSR